MNGFGRRSYRTIFLENLIRALSSVAWVLFFALSISIPVVAVNLGLVQSFFWKSLAIMWVVLWVIVGLVALASKEEYAAQDKEEGKYY